nr:CDP-diacylglycerol diphosphatase [Pantoea sp. 201603H]
MQSRNRFLTVIAAILTLLVIALAGAAFYVHKNADALWEIVSERCVPGMQAHGHPAPCENVDEAKGYVTLKDRVGPLQFLLMPVAKISGIEDPQILYSHTPNFFALAWDARHLMAERRGAFVSDSHMALAINAEYSRTQNQLHVHISCLRADVRQQLDQLSTQLTSQWQPTTILKHSYFIRALTLHELDEKSVFIRLAEELPDARGEMWKYGMALAALPDGRLALMAIKENWLKLNRGSGEEIQDHDCKIL